MDDPLMLVLRLLHIGAGVLWVGAAWTLHLFVTPSLRAAGRAAEQAVMGHAIRQRKMDKVIIGATIVTVGAGLTMLFIDISRAGVDAWFSSGFGIGITIGALAAIVSFLIGPILILPITTRIGSLGQQLATAGSEAAAVELELDELARRLHRILTVDSAALVVAVLFMAIARYL